MSSRFEPDLAVDTNISHTMATLQDVMLSQNSLTNLLENACSCTLKDIFHSRTEPIDITHYSTEEQVQILNGLVSQRFESVCFTEDEHPIFIKCFLNPDREIRISNWITFTPEESLKFQTKTSQISVNSKLRLACLVTDQHYVRDLMTQAPDIEDNTLLFYGISCEGIVDILVEEGAKVNARDKRQRTPLFYAITNSSGSARKLLAKCASVKPRVLSYFLENMMKKGLPSLIKSEGIRLLSSKDITQKQMIKEVTNLIFCKFFQGLARDNSFNPSILCETLRWILGEDDGDDEINALINQLQSTPPHNSFEFDAVRPLFDILNKLGAKASYRDSEKNTCLHYAIRSLFHGVSLQTVTQIFEKLMELDAQLDANNYKKETPLLFSLSSKYLIAQSETHNWSGSLHNVCQLLVENGSELGNTTHKGESVFHLVLNVFQHVLLQSGDQNPCIFKEMVNILNLFSNQAQERNIVNIRDNHLNSPLHLWASLALRTADHYLANVSNDQSFEDLLKRILDLLINCGIQLNDINEEEEKPLHMCRTWTAVKLLLGVGARPTETDSTGCTPLITAAMRNTCLKNGADHFYPDVTETPKEFWKEILERKLDPWTFNKKGDSVLSILIEKEAISLAGTLIEVACEQNYVQSDEIGVPLLIALCREKSPDKKWKFNLVEKLIRTNRSLVNGTWNKCTPFYVICENLVNLCDESVVRTPVQWDIVQHLRLYGADVTDDVISLSRNSRLLSNFLERTVDQSTIPLALEKWEQSSEKHAPQLARVARQIDYQNVKTLYFSKKPLDEDKGSLGLVFVGIVQGNSSIADGREVAVKCINKSNMPNKSALEYVHLSSDNLRHEQVVRYLCCEDNGEHYYIALELMEGNLEDDMFIASEGNATKLCQHVVMGLRFLHSEGGAHGNIYPRTVFYKNKPNLCLKIGNCKVDKRVRGWTAPELLENSNSKPTKKSDIFSCGLVLHHILSAKKHPFAPVDSTTRPKGEVLIQIESNILSNNIVKLDDSLSPEAIDLVQLMLDGDAGKRPSAEDALAHPFFWDNKTKEKFIHILANEQNTKSDEQKTFYSELENRFSTIVTKCSQWNDPVEYSDISTTLEEMKRKVYKFHKIAELIRFIRNVYEHIPEVENENIQRKWKEGFVFKDYFPRLVIEVYKALTRSESHQLHMSRQEINKFLGLKATKHIYF